MERRSRIAVVAAVTVLGVAGCDGGIDGEQQVEENLMDTGNAVSDEVDDAGATGDGTDD